MRMEKIKSRSSLVRAAQHNTRERDPPNADQEKKSLNWSTGPVDDIMAKYSQLLPVKVRKNAVHAVELLMTASPDYSGDWDRYLRNCDKWAEGLFGKGNILSVTHHFDESTPHTHLLVIPLADGKLNAKHFIGGSRDRMSELQDDFFQNVGQPFGMERGRPKAETKVRHSHPALYKKFVELEKREEKMDEWDERQEARLHKLESELSADERKSIFGDGEYTAGDALELLEQHKIQKIIEREKKLSASEKKLDEFANMSGFDVREMKNRLDNWDRQSPESLRGLAKVIESKNFRTVGEYRKAQEVQRDREQSRRSNFSI